jgi:hypothetical protein
MPIVVDEATARAKFVIETSRPAGDSGPLIVRVRRAGKRRKIRRGGLVEQMVHQAADAAATTATVYLCRHERSNRRKRDGWLRDLPNNVYTATFRGQRCFLDWNRDR